jgi:energy-coupling factor transport system substrate-specific component
LGHSALESSVISLKFCQYGLYRYDGVDFTRFSPADTLGQGRGFSLLTDSSGRLWVGRHNGVVVYDGAKFTRQPQFDGKTILTMFEDSRTRIWFGTPNSGVLKTDGAIVTAITNADGLPSNHVTAIAEDKGGNIWIGTDKGLARYFESPTAPLIHIESIESDQIYPFSEHIHRERRIRQSRQEPLPRQYESRNSHAVEHHFGIRATHPARGESPFHPEGTLANHPEQWKPPSGCD